jgi:hypothetical protein
MSNGNWAFGAVLTRAGNPIAEITNITVPEKTADWLDLTNHGSTGGAEEGVPTIIRTGQLDIEGNFYAGDTLGQIALNSDLDNRTLRAYVLTFPAAAAAALSFNGYVVAFKPADAPYDGKLAFTASIKITGVATLSVTASTGMSALSGIDAGGALVFNPAFAIGTFDYVVDVTNARTYIKLTPTAAAHTITVTAPSGSEQNVSSGVQSGEVALGAAGTVNIVTVKVQESGKIAKTYTIRVNKAA